MEIPVLVAEKTRLQRIWRRLTWVRIPISIVLTIVITATVIAVFGHSWGISDQIQELLWQLGTALESGGFWMGIVSMLLSAPFIGYPVHLVFKWNDRFDKTPNSIHFNGHCFEEISDGKKSVLGYTPSWKRGSLSMSDDLIPLKISPGINEYKFSEMVDSHIRHRKIEKGGNQTIDDL